MKAQTSLVDEVANELGEERRKKEEERKRKKREEAAQEKEYTRSLKKSIDKIIPHLESLLDDEKFMKILCDPKLYHPIKTSPYQSLLPSDDMLNMEKFFLSRATPEEKKKYTESARTAKLEKADYEERHKVLLNVFKKASATDKVFKFPYKTSDGVGIKLCSFSDKERHKGKMSGEEYDSTLYYHVMLVLQLGELSIRVFKPYIDSEIGGEYWGEPLLPQAFPTGIDKLIHSLARGGKSMISTIMRDRLESKNEKDYEY